MSNDTKSNLSNKKIEFLYSAIKDAQELIRFTDTKTAVIIPILASFIITYFAKSPDIIKNINHLNLWFWIPFVIFVILILLSILIILRIINPTQAPNKNIKINESDYPKLSFFIPEMDYRKNIFYRFINSDKFKLDFEYNFLIDQLIFNEEKKDKYINEEDIIKTLSFEFLKVSFIRNIKMKRLTSLLWFLFFTLVFFVLSYIILLNQIQVVPQVINCLH